MNSLRNSTIPGLKFLSTPTRSYYTGGIIQRVRNFEKLAVFTLGKLSAIKGIGGPKAFPILPQTYFILPYIQQACRIDLREKK